MKLSRIAVIDTDREALKAQLAERRRKFAKPEEPKKSYRKEDAVWALYERLPLELKTAIRHQAVRSLTHLGAEVTAVTLKAEVARLYQELGGFYFVKDRAKPGIVGEVDAQGKIQVRFPFGDRDESEVLWVRIHPSLCKPDFKSGVGVLDSEPRHISDLKIGDQIRFKTYDQQDYPVFYSRSSVKPKEVSPFAKINASAKKTAEHGMATIMADVADSLREAMTFNPIKQRAN